MSFHSPFEDALAADVVSGRIARGSSRRGFGGFGGGSGGFGGGLVGSRSTSPLQGTIGSQRRGGIIRRALDAIGSLPSTRRDRRMSRPSYAPSYYDQGYYGPSYYGSGYYNYGAPLAYPYSYFPTWLSPYLVASNAWYAPYYWGQSPFAFAYDPALNFTAVDPYILSTQLSLETAAQSPVDNVDLITVFNFTPLVVDVQVSSSGSTLNQTLTSDKNTFMVPVDTTKPYQVAFRAQGASEWMVPETMPGTMIKRLDTAGRDAVVEYRNTRDNRYRVVKIGDKIYNIEQIY